MWKERLVYIFFFNWLLILISISFRLGFELVFVGVRDEFIGFFVFVFLGFSGRWIGKIWEYKII